MLPLLRLKLVLKLEADGGGNGGLLFCGFLAVAVLDFFVFRDGTLELILELVLLLLLRRR